MTEERATPRPPLGPPDDAPMQSSGRSAEAGASPPEFAPEAAGPTFSKGGHRAGEPGGEPSYGERDLTDDERAVRGSAQPERH